MNDVVFLFIGGFIVALAMQKWGLHKRIALIIILTIGGGPRRTLLGFMAASAFLSMWISNTATAMMMMPIAMAVLNRYDELLGKERAKGFAIALLLGVAHASTAGGIGTLVGTPPNLVFASIFHSTFPNAPEISFVSWMMFALPFSITLFFTIWGILNIYIPRDLKLTGTRDVFKKEFKEMGKPVYEEKVVLWVFLALALLWIFRKNLTLGAFIIPGWSNLLPFPSYVGDGTVAIALGVLLFLIPSKKKGEAIIDWATARKLPWSIVLLFGGGFALAGAVRTSGLADWIGMQMSGLSSLPPAVMTGSIAMIITFSTELTSNTATTQMILPVLAAVGVSIGRNPLFLMVPATLSASCAFMMPVATPPNAIVFGTGRLRIIDMAKSGILINIAGAILIVIFVHAFGHHFFGANTLPDWVN